MATSEQEINSFSEFAKSRIKKGGSDSSLAELRDEWAIENPPAEDAYAIQASIRDMENDDTGQPFQEFASEFRKRNDIDSGE
jgi:hypothetical protein